MNAGSVGIPVKSDNARRYSSYGLCQKVFTVPIVKGTFSLFLYSCPEKF